MKETHTKDGKRMDDKEMKNLERSLDGVGKYLGRIEKLFGLHVSVHTPNAYLVTYLESFYKYNCHMLPYCMLIKSDKSRWKRCRACQRMVTARFCELGDKGRDGFFGRCFFGVEEFVLPVLNDGKTIGFVSVTGYSTDRERTRRTAARLIESFPDGYDEALAGLSDRLPDPELLRDLLTPAADLIGSFHFIPELRGSGNYTYRLMVAEIEACYNERLSVARIAKSVNCSESYINHIFKKKSGMSVSSYINTVRVRHAKELLTSADEPVSAVAFAVGYSDANYFSDVFRKIVGMTPTAYRNMYRRRKGG